MKVNRLLTLVILFCALLTACGGQATTTPTGGLPADAAALAADRGLTPIF